jgi:hypothetical protein
MYRLMVIAFALLFVGCQQRIEQESAFEPEEAEYVLTIVLDLSSSFRELLDDKAWTFLCQIIDRYFEDRIGYNDKLILAQLSASDRVLLWKGTTLELRQEFKSGAEFRAWIDAKADPNGSDLYEGIVQVVDYTLSDPAGAKGKSAVLVLSDMIDSKGADGRERAVEALAKVGKGGGSVGLYYVDVKQCALWKKLLRDAGVPDAKTIVEADIVGHPTLPRFE